MAGGAGWFTPTAVQNSPGAQSSRPYVFCGSPPSATSRAQLFPFVLVPPVGTQASSAPELADTTAHFGFAVSAHRPLTGLQRPASRAGGAASTAASGWLASLPASAGAGVVPPLLLLALHATTAIAHAVKRQTRSREEGAIVPDAR